ncbi:hypothetical protein GCM10007874_15570 [Labrys miyagiensis]|uniref:Uncharacterized protein n=2 Tax=Labrys miyagiensis TaxID=346912 RepID=A0ABQ6CF46_9HYPH|nr:hypothetical protein GCM10007874_15570 [Labrys miyagiensis]
MTCLISPSPINPEELSFRIQRIEPDNRILQTLEAMMTISSAIAAYEVLVELWPKDLRITLQAQR